MRSLSITRRAFLAATGAATGLTALPAMATAAAAPLNLGIQLYSLRGYPVDEALRHARELGVTFVEFYPGMWPVNADAAAISSMTEKLAALGLKVSAHGVNRFTSDAAANPFPRELTTPPVTKMYFMVNDPIGSQWKIQLHRKATRIEFELGRA